MAGSTFVLSCVVGFANIVLVTANRPNYVAARVGADADDPDALVQIVEQEQPARLSRPVDECSRHSLTKSLDFSGANSLSYCNDCLRETGCAWCAMDQLCMSKSTSCRTGKPKASCDSSTPLWVTGDAGSDTNDVLNIPTVETMDKAFCMLAIPGGRVPVVRIEEEQTAPTTAAWTIDMNSPPISAKVVKDKAMRYCQSAMLREALEMMLIDGPPASATVYPATLFGFKSWTWWPPLCRLLQQPGSQLFVDGACQVSYYGADLFKKLREQADQAAPGLIDRLKSSIRSGPLVFNDGTISQSSGIMTTTADTAFAVKTDLDGAHKEHLTVLRLATGQSDLPGAESLFDYLEKNKDSVLSHLFGLVSWSYGKTTYWGLLMTEPTQGAFHKYVTASKAAGINAAGTGPFLYNQYVMKNNKKSGSERSAAPGSTKMLGDFKMAEGGKLNMFEDPTVAVAQRFGQCNTFRKALHKDIDYLHKHKITNYKLALSASASSNGQSMCQQINVGEPKCFEGKDRGYTVSLEDYFLKSDDMAFVSSVQNHQDAKDSMDALVDEVCPMPADAKDGLSTLTVILAMSGFVILMTAFGVAAWFCLKKGGTQSRAAQKSAQSWDRPFPPPPGPDQFQSVPPHAQPPSHWQAPASSSSGPPGHLQAAW